MTKHSIYSRVTYHLEEVREGFLSGHAEMFGHRFEVEAFAVEPDSWNVPLGARAKRLEDLLEGLMIDDVPLQAVKLPPFEGDWLLFVMPEGRD